MTPVDAAELSAFLDGELAPARAREVEAAIAANPSLRAEFSALSQADTIWRATASSARFQPKIDIAGGVVASGYWAGLALAVILLVAIRILPKLSGTVELGFLVHSGVLAIFLAWIIQTERKLKIP